MKKQTLKKMVAITCAITVFLTTMSINGLSVKAEGFANEYEEDAVTIAESEEEVVKNASTEENAAKEQSTEEVDSENTVEEITEEETLTEEVTTEETTIEEEEDVVLSVEINEVLVKATAKAGVFPKDAILDVKEVYTTNVMEKTIGETINNEVSEDAHIEEIISYDITILSNGEAVQPQEGTVAITFEGINLEEGQDATVVYTSDDASIAETQDTTSVGDTVGFEAEHFSLYNVVITSKNGKTLPKEIISFVPQTESTYIDLGSYFSLSYTISVADSSILKAYTADSKLVLTAYETSDNKQTTVTLNDGKKELIITVYVTGKPAKTSSGFMDMIQDKVGLCSSDNKINDSNKYMAEFFNGKRDKIDSTSPTGVRTELIKQAVGEENLKNYSYAMWHINSDKTVFIYAPVDFSLSVVGDLNDTTNANRFKASFEDVNQYILTDCYTYTNATGTLSSEQMMYKLTTNKISGETVTYPIFYLCAANVESDTANNQYKIDEKLKVIFEVDDAYKADYDLTGGDYKGDICERILDSNRITSFGAVLSSAAQSRISGVIMTLAEDVTGYKGTTPYLYKKGTQISSLNINNNVPNAYVVYNDADSAADQFGFVEFPSGTTVHILVKPAVFNVNVYDADGKLDSNQSKTVVCQNAVTAPTDAMKTSDGTYTYQFDGYSETEKGTPLTANELSALLSSVIKDINLYPIFTATRIPVVTTAPAGTTDDTADTVTTTVFPVTTTTIPAVQTPLAATPLLNTVVAQNQVPAQENDGVNNPADNIDANAPAEDVLIEDQQVPLDIETQTVDDSTKNIEEEATPLSTIDHNCFIHWIMLALILLYVVYTAIRVYQRKKEEKDA